MARPAGRADVIAEVERVGRRFADRTVFVGIDGFGAAGKSTLAGAVAARVPRAVVVHVDDFSGPTNAEWEFDRFRAQVLHPLLAGAAARYCAWDWVRDEPGEWLMIEPGRIVLVEGVSSTRTEAGVDWDLTIWVQAPHPVRLQRALERDGADMMPRWTDDWMPSEQAYAAREDPERRCDLVVDGTA